MGLAIALLGIVPLTICFVLGSCWEIFASKRRLEEGLPKLPPLFASIGSILWIAIVLILSSTIIRSTWRDDPYRENAFTGFMIACGLFGLLFPITPSIVYSVWLKSQKKP